MREPISFETPEEADKALRHIQRGIGPVTVACPPTGHTTPMALLGLLGGGIAGAAAAAIVSSGVLCAGAALVWGGMSLLESTAKSTGTLHVGGFIMICLLGLLALAGAILLGGAAAADMTVRAGRWAGNQSMPVAGLVAAVAGAGGMLLSLRPIMPLLMGQFMPHRDAGTVIHAMAGDGITGTIVLVVLLVLTTLAAGGYGAGKTADTRACSACGAVMKRVKLPRVEFQAAAIVVEAIRRDDVPGLARALEEREGNATRTLLYVCPACRRGAMEVRLVFKADLAVSGPKGEPGTLEMNALVASREITPEQVDRLERQLGLLNLPQVPPAAIGDRHPRGIRRM